MKKNNTSILKKVLFAVSWPISDVKKRRIYIAIEKNTFLIQFLHAISYSQHELIIQPKAQTIDPELKITIRQLTALWDKTQKAMQEKRLTVAKNSLQKIIEIDKFNAAAYNRLGIIYAKKSEYALSINYFKIAAGLESTAASNHNLGLIYYEVQDYKKSLKYFKRSLKLEYDLAARHIAIAKVYEKIGNDRQMIRHLENAYKLESSVSTFKLLFAVYKDLGMTVEIKLLEQQMKTKKVKEEIEPKKNELNLQQSHLLLVDSDLKYLYG